MWIRSAAALALAACATPAPAPRLSPEAALAVSEPDVGALVVRLGFGAEADLDLYVSDPHAETVYFANSPTASGGELLADRRCEHPAPRIETVRFREALPGRYRVGVDYPEACGDAGPVRFAVEVIQGSRRELFRGTAEPGVFQVVVIEFDVEEGDS
jgi:hypothetical protein